MYYIIYIVHKLSFLKQPSTDLKVLATELCCFICKKDHYLLHTKCPATAPVCSAPCMFDFFADEVWPLLPLKNSFSLEQLLLADRQRL